LVDKLRKGNHPAVSLPDVAALTEILMRSLESYFKSVDLTIYQECQSLADYIEDARREIASLSPEHKDDAKIPRAGLELAAIVEQTESATNTIMESAERIMESDPGDAEAYRDTVNDAVMQIFEACSFQDITGQRISKVVTTLEHVENRVDRLIHILGVMNEDPAKAKEPEKAEIESGDKSLLNGPALEGEGIDQSEIDALLDGEDAAADEPAPEVDDSEEANAPADETAGNDAETADATPSLPTGETADQGDIDSLFDETEVNGAGDAEGTPQAEPTSPSEAKANLIEQAKQQKAAAALKAKARIKPSKPIVYEADANAGLQPKTSEKTTQADIDALFS